MGKKDNERERERVDRKKKTRNRSRSTMETERTHLPRSIHSASEKKNPKPYGGHMEAIWERQTRNESESEWTERNRQKKQKQN